jgi:hypothetical protein
LRGLTVMTGSVGELWAEGISAELAAKLPKQGKPQRRKLATMVATMLKVRSANLMELASGLPTETARSDMRYQWITRLLASDLLDCDTVMRPFATDIFENLQARGEPITLIMDQSKLSDRHQGLMLAVAWGERALPVAWRVEETEGSIGFSTQEALLSAVQEWLPEGCDVVLMGDRFYGSPDLILWLTKRKWRYRLRLKGNLKVIDGKIHTTTGELAQSGQTNFENLRLTAKRVTTNIGVIHDPGHAEPWIIAMSDPPSYLKTLEYSQRWGIEPMFSDFKSRGFGLAQTQIRYPERLTRLILIMALALYWAVSAGMLDVLENPLPAEKKIRKNRGKSSDAADSPGSPAACATSTGC